MGESDGSRYQVPYELSVRKGHFSWGAEGATASVLLSSHPAPHGGGIGAAGGAAAMAALKRIRNRVRPEGANERILHTRKELEEYGRWSVRAAYRDWITDHEPLPLMVEESSDEAWTGSFRDQAGNEYSVTLRPREGHPYRVRISRRAT